ncbi:unnamed protein product [Ilex paraguariensis]|uniref:ABC transporter domain-containing protein n=1 Tax=Ilex paraguariensis TaxID=185542 RepID=A0ABC8TF76_9AQUA
MSGSLPFLMSVPKTEYGSVMPRKPTTDELIQVLEDVNLGYLLSQFCGLDNTYEWSSVLSLGEQQRLAFARLLLSKPCLVLLDESTSALDEANEIEAAGITYMSVGHRSSLCRYHNRILRISAIDPNNTRCNWNIEIINQDTTMYNLSNQ